MEACSSRGDYPKEVFPVASGHLGHVVDIDFRGCLRALFPHTDNGLPKEHSSKCDTVSEASHDGVSNYHRIGVLGTLSDQDSGGQMHLQGEIQVPGRIF